MVVWESHLSWLWLAGGITLGILGAFGAIWFLGRKTAKALRLDDRGECDLPLPQPFPPEQVVAVYKRRKSYHKHDRHYYRRQRSRKGRKGKAPTG